MSKDESEALELRLLSDVVTELHMLQARVSKLELSVKFLTETHNDHWHPDGERPRTPAHKLKLPK